MKMDMSYAAVDAAALPPSFSRGLSLLDDFFDLDSYSQQCLQEAAHVVLQPEEQQPPEEQPVVGLADPVDLGQLQESGWPVETYLEMSEVQDKSLFVQDKSLFAELLVEAGLEELLSSVESQIPEIPSLDIVHIQLPPPPLQLHLETRVTIRNVTSVVAPGDLLTIARDSPQLACSVVAQGLGGCALPDADLELELELLHQDDRPVRSPGANSGLLRGQIRSLLINGRADFQPRVLALSSDFNGGAFKLRCKDSRGGEVFAETPVFVVKSKVRTPKEGTKSKGKMAGRRVCGELPINTQNDSVLNIGSSNSMVMLNAGFSLKRVLAVQHEQMEKEREQHGRLVEELHVLKKQCRA